MLTDTKIYLTVEFDGFGDRMYVSKAVGNITGKKYIGLKGYVLSCYGENVSEYPVEEDINGQYINVSDYTELCST